MTTLEQMKTQWETFIAENERFSVKGVKASAGRARKALGDLAKLAKVRRKEIMDEKAALSNKGQE